MLDRGINRFFWEGEKWFFRVWVIGTVIGILPDVIGRGVDPLVALRQSAMVVGALYVPVAVAVAILWLFVLKIEPVQLYVFYNFWIGRVFKFLKTRAAHPAHSPMQRVSKWLLQRNFDEYYDSLILDSWTMLLTSKKYEEQHLEQSYKNKPVLVRREHLAAKAFFPNWAYASLVLFNDLKITRRQIGNRNRIRLEVDLRNQSYGIYNNAGKVFLANKFLEGRATTPFSDKAAKAAAFIKGDTHANELVIKAADTPFRWASGGVLLVARWKEKYWYVLSFRGVKPVGWNLANGSAESKDEYKNLYNLMVRELSEEIVLLDREPKVDDPAPIVQKVFRFSEQIFDDLPEHVKNEIRSKAFMERHCDLRKKHDNLHISLSEGPMLKSIDAPFEVQITYHDKNLKDSLTKTVENAIFSVNPFEFGIETVGLYWFDMEDGDYLMFGEIWEVADCLLPEPILLLSCDYAQSVYETDGGSLGEHITVSPHLDCKSLACIPQDAYVIFDKDIELRQRRADQLAKQATRTRAEEAELNLYRSWQADYGNLFASIRGKDIEKAKNPKLTMLCPVTWKTIETICRYGVLKNLPR